MNSTICINDITSYLESIAPLTYQESYDNSGLQIGFPAETVQSVLITLDVTEEIVDEAIKKGANLIVAHHPLIFSGIKKLTGQNFIERTIQKAIKNDIAIYAAHTNLDSITGGVNSKICEKLNLQECKILQPTSDILHKLVTFIPTSHINQVQEAIFKAGAGQIGNYDFCGFSAEGNGSFRGGENSNPFVGEKGTVHTEKEIRFETIFPKHLQNIVVNALISAHPYEEVAYDIYPLNNIHQKIGIGMVGQLEKPVDEIQFLETLKSTFNCQGIKHTKLLGKKINKVAVCGGSGSFLLKNALASKADIFVTGDFKYHQFFDAEEKIVIADIGHYESEQFTKELFYELLTKKFPKFAVHLSEINTNPVNYY